MTLTDRQLTLAVRAYVEEDARERYAPGPDRDRARRRLHLHACDREARINEALRRNEGVRLTARAQGMIKRELKRLQSQARAAEATHDEEQEQIGAQRPLGTHRVYAQQEAAVVASTVIAPTPPAAGEDERESLARFISLQPEVDVNEWDDCLGLADAILARHSPGWRDIASAPRDGTAVLVWSIGCGFDVCRNHGQGWDDGERSFMSWPTHWQPLPAPPTGAPS